MRRSPLIRLWLPSSHNSTSTRKQQSEL